MIEGTIYDYIKGQEVNYRKPIQLEDGWDWSMKEHLRISFLYKHSQFADKNENRDLRPNKNIVKAILNIGYRTEGFDVKDIELYVNNSDFYYKSFIVKKYHEKWARENSIDTFIDELVESYIDYGGVLIRDTSDKRPEDIDLRSLAFCNQTDILAFPFAIKHRFSPAKLREMDKWGKNENGATIDMESLLILCKDEPEIIVYEVHGVMPERWLISGESKKDIRQIQVVAFYKDSNKNELGVCLFKHKEPKLPFKLLKRDDIKGRALGWGGVEELFESQIWTNWTESKITEMLDAASKTLFKTTDPQFKTRNNLNNVNNNEVFTLQEGRDITQMDTYPRNVPVFNQAMEQWEIHAQQLGSASEGLLGESPSSGTPFKLYEAQNIEAKSMHRYRQGKIAVFVDEIYRDWILPHISKEVVKDQQFLTELSADEMQEITEQISENLVNKRRNGQVLNGENPQNKELLKQEIKIKYGKSNKKFIKILKDEMKDAPLAIRTNIAGKQKNLALLTDKLVNVLRQFIATPEIRQDPGMVKLLNTILESSGMSPIIFGASPAIGSPTAQGSTEPLKALSQGQLQAKEAAMA